MSGMETLQVLRHPAQGRCRTSYGGHHGGCRSDLPRHPIDQIRVDIDGLRGRGDLLARSAVPGRFGCRVAPVSEQRDRAETEEAANDDAASREASRKTGISKDLVATVGHRETLSNR